MAGECWLAVAVLSIAIGPAPSAAEEYLRSVAQRATVSRVNYALFALTDLLVLPAVMALYQSLKHVAKNAMLIAVGLMLFWAIPDLGVTELNSLMLVTLGRQYVAAAGTVASTPGCGLRSRWGF